MRDPVQRDHELAAEEAASLIRQFSDMAARKATELAQASETDEEADFWSSVRKECQKQLSELRIQRIKKRDELT